VKAEKHRFDTGIYRDCFCGWKARLGSWSTMGELRKLWADHVATDSSTCPRCMGTGKYKRLPMDSEKDCAICNGTGQIVGAAQAARKVDDDDQH